MKIILFALLSFSLSAQATYLDLNSKVSCSNDAITNYSHLLTAIGEVEAVPLDVVDKDKWPDTVSTKLKAWATSYEGKIKALNEILKNDPTKREDVQDELDWLNDLHKTRIVDGTWTYGNLQILLEGAIESGFEVQPNGNQVDFWIVAMNSDLQPVRLTKTPIISIDKKFVHPQFFENARQGTYTLYSSWTKTSELYTLFLAENSSTRRAYTQGDSIIVTYQGSSDSEWSGSFSLIDMLHITDVSCSDSEAKGRDIPQASRDAYVDDPNDAIFTVTIPAQ